MSVRIRLILAALGGVVLSSPSAAQNIGPSTTTEPYVLPSIPGVSTISILTTGDSVGGYRMVGVPDGTGAWVEDGNEGRDRGIRAFNFVSNHEIGRTLGAVRAHGSQGAFVSRWVIERDTLQVLSGRDHL